MNEEDKQLEKLGKKYNIDEKLLEPGDPKNKWWTIKPILIVIVFWVVLGIIVQWIRGH